MSYDVIVVGGGIGGLIASTSLAKNGFSVLLLEKTRILGGRARTVVRDGFTLDYGIHVIRFGEFGLLPKIFKNLDIKIEILDLGESYIISEKMDILPINLKGIMKTNYLEEGEKERVMEILMDISRLDHNKWMRRSISEYLGSSFENRVKKLISIISGLLLVIPEIHLASMGELARLIKTAIKVGKGAGYPRGSWRNIFIELELKTLELGGEIKFGNKVKGVKIENNKVHGVYVGNRLIPCNNVILAVPAHEIKNIVASKYLPESYLRKLNVKPTKGVALDIAIGDIIYDFNGLIVFEDPFIFGLATSGVDDTISPIGKQLYTFFMPVSPEKFDVVKDEAMNTLKTTVFSFLPKIREKMIWNRELYLPIVDGAAPYYYQSWVDRADVETPIRDLYVVGDSYKAPGAGSDIAVATAIEAYEKILEKY